MQANPECKMFLLSSSQNFKFFNKFSESFNAFSAFFSSFNWTYRSAINLQICERRRSSGCSMSSMVEIACQNSEMAAAGFPALELLMAFCLRTFTIKFSYSSFYVPHSSSNDSRAWFDCTGVILLSMTRLNNASLFSTVKYSPSNLREGCFSNLILICGYSCSVILVKRRVLRKRQRIIWLLQSTIDDIIQRDSLIVMEIYSSHLNSSQSQYFIMSGTSHKYSKKKSDGNYRISIGDGEISQASLHSQGKQEGETEGNEKFFSFSQSFNNIEHNEKIIQDKANSLNRIKSLEQELKSCKSRSSLWQKAKAEIISLNKYLKLSAISLGCSDSAIMKEFFQSINDLLISKEDKNNDEKLKVVENKKKEAELFEKLVESNKKKYQLEQKLVQYEYEISKLTDTNESLREKSRAQSTERSSKIREFHEETLYTLQQKDSVLETLEERGNELILEMVRKDQTISALKSQLQSKERDLAQTKDSNQQLYLECEALKREIQELMEEEKENQMAFSSIHGELQKIVDENVSLRNQLKKKKEELANLRSVIEDAKATNDEYLKEIQHSTQEQELKRQERITQLLQKEEMLKQNLASSSKFAIVRKKSKRAAMKLLNSLTEKQSPSSQAVLH